LDFIGLVDTYRLQFAGWALDMRRQVKDRAKVGKLELSTGGVSLHAIQAISYAGVSFDHRGYPRFTPKEPSLGVVLRQVLPCLAFLVAGCILVAASGYWLFLRYPWL
jgi:hypothetical protein